jgi:hypothetical protein
MPTLTTATFTEIAMAISTRPSSIDLLPINELPPLSLEEELAKALEDIPEQLARRGRKPRGGIRSPDLDFGRTADR